jgi:predicted GNAT superfamily acetyltransferase
MMSESGRSSRTKTSISIDPFAAVFKATSWADELAVNPKLKRADIARREGISRAPSTTDPLPG